MSKNKKLNDYGVCEGVVNERYKPPRYIECDYCGKSIQFRDAYDYNYADDPSFLCHDCFMEKTGGGPVKCARCQGKKTLPYKTKRGPTAYMCSACRSELDG